MAREINNLSFLDFLKFKNYEQIQIDEKTLTFAHITGGHVDNIIGITEDKSHTVISADILLIGKRLNMDEASDLTKSMLAMVGKLIKHVNGIPFNAVLYEFGGGGFILKSMIPITLSADYSVYNEIYDNFMHDVETYRDKMYTLYTPLFKDRTISLPTYAIG